MRDTRGLGLEPLSLHAGRLGLEVEADSPDIPAWPRRTQIRESGGKGAVNSRGAASRLLARLPWVFGVAAAYASLAFGWSAMGLLTPGVPVHLHEYPLPALFREVGGHLLFGLAAGLATLDAPLVLLCGAESVLIDSDHLLSALNFPVEPRLAHSVSFIVVVPLLMAVLAGRGRRLDRSVLLVTGAALAAHLGYDVFAGNGSIPALAPFSLAFYSLPYWTWPALESAAFLLCALTRVRPRMEP